MHCRNSPSSADVQRAKILVALTSLTGREKQHMAVQGFGLRCRINGAAPDGESNSRVRPRSEFLRNNGLLPCKVAFCYTQTCMKTLSFLLLSFAALPLRAQVKIEDPAAETLVS